MNKIILLAVSLVMASCSNTAYQQPVQPSDITGVYSKSRVFLSATNTTVLKLNADGTGFECFYSGDKPQPKKTPIKHIGGNQWASAAIGTGLVERVGGDSIKWGLAGTFVRTNLEDTSCK